MRRFPVLILVCACMGALRTTSAQWAGEPSYVLRVHVTDRERQIPILAGMDLDLAGLDPKANTADFVGSEETLQRLKDAGFDPEIVWTPPVSAIDALSDYLDPTEVSSRLDAYQAAYPAIAKKYSLGTTANGRTVWAMKISDNWGIDEDEPVAFFVGQHHAREVMTTEITMDIIDYLLTRYATDPRVHAWVDSREIWVVVSENPDGASYVFTNSSSWRKNRRNNGDGTFGVDPNRNYPYRWGFCNGSSAQTSSDTYRGPSAGSELETQAYTALAMARHPVVALSYHTYSELVIHPPGCPNVFTPENRMFRDLTSNIAVQIPNDGGDGWYSNGTPWELLYAVDGDSDAWFYAALGTAAITIEANSSSQGFLPDYATWRNSTVARNRAGWQYLLDRTDASSIWGHVTDACTGAPLTASIGLDEVVFSAGETPRTSEPVFGRYQWLTAPGLWHINVSKAGYRTQSWAEDVGLEAARREVHLVPTGSFAVEIQSSSIQDAGGDGDGALDPGEAVTMPVRAVATGGALSGLTAVLSSSDPYVSITNPTASWPSIAAGGSADPSVPFAFTVSPQTPDGHVVPFHVAFSAAQTLCTPGGLGYSPEVPVSIGAPACPAISEPLDVNPGWAIQNSDSLGWAFGPPVGGGGNNGPTTGHTGTKVYGTNLSGAYGNSADYQLITTPFNLTSIRGAELRFWRWLNNEAGYDLASVDVSTDGTHFTNVWSGFGRDTQWEPYRFDISSLADGRSTVYVRFRLISDSSTTASGFYIDDVSICGDTLPPTPSLQITSYSFDDAQSPACTDHDAYPDRGETASLSVTYKNQGSLAALGAVATLSSSNPHIAMIDFRAALGDVPPGGTGIATFRFKVADGTSCREPAPLQLSFSANGAAYQSTDSTITLTLQADDGAPVPNSFENFEGAGGWTLTGEWQIGTPQAKGGTAGSGGSGTPDPASAFSGTKALGVDLTGLGLSQGNYENNLSAGITATSPVYDCSHVSNVQVSFKRWLGVEQSQYDRATVQAWNGSAWQTIWTNPNVNLNDISWQSVSYDVTPYAAGRSDFRVRFGLTSDASVVYCGWNIDDLTITNGYVPQNCETGACAPGCTPVSQISGPSVTHQSGVTTLSWTPSASACHEGGGAGYRVYRAPSARPRVPMPAQWPADSYFVDVTTRDLDGSAANPSFQDAESPLWGTGFFYLVVDMGTSGAEGLKGWQGY